MVIKVDFKNRKTITFDQYQQLDSYEKYTSTAPIGPVEAKLAPMLKDTYFQLSLLDNIAARFGDTPMVHAIDGCMAGGPIYKTTKKYIYLDTYGLGCSNNDLGNPFKPIMEKQGKWNRPFPVPMHPVALMDALLLAKSSGKTIRLGNKQDPLAWLDMRYQWTRSFLKHALELDVNVEIFTSSDLVAHQEYIDITKHFTIIMKRPTEVKKSDCENVPREIERITGMNVRTMDDFSHINIDDFIRKYSPGAPSLVRRDKALGVLLENGARVKLYEHLAW